MSRLALVSPLRHEEFVWPTAKAITELQRGHPTCEKYASWSAEKKCFLTAAGKIWIPGDALDMQVRICVVIQCLGMDDLQSSWELALSIYEDAPVLFRRWAKARSKEDGVANSSSYLAKKTHGPRATLHGKGNLESVEFSSDLVAFMESVRDGEHFITTADLVTWMKSHRPLWLKAYMDAKLNDDRAYKSLLQWS
ncbi:hypothetical protein DYB28_003098 [Aphanomyces astaci]|uniref:Uncharacterized protein n=1 Tax=Aphanomyces astaci TaxID=112090 RepID=A0A9X8E644_APHAT|nr:hypothetical protein DYB28_003098 [Aphanomyces astaci]